MNKKSSPKISQLAKNRLLFEKMQKLLSNRYVIKTVIMRFWVC